MDSFDILKNEHTLPNYLFVQALLYEPLILLHLKNINDTFYLNFYVIFLLYHKLLMNLLCL